MRQLVTSDSGTLNHQHEAEILNVLSLYNVKNESSPSMGGVGGVSMQLLRCSIQCTKQKHVRTSGRAMMSAPRPVYEA